MSFRESEKEESASSLSELSSFDDDFSQMELESGNFDEGADD